MHRALGTALLAAGVAVAGHGAPGLTAIGPVRRALFPRLAGLGRPGHVALTFDDGPDPGCTPDVLAALDRAQVRATFFMLGPMARANRGLAADVAAAGHEIGVHGWAHRYATLRGPRALLDDLARASDALADATGTVPRLYRPPYGVLSAGALAAARPAGAAADPVELLGTRVGSRCHPGVGAGHAEPGTGRRRHRAAARFFLHQPACCGQRGARRAAVAIRRMRPARAERRATGRAWMRNPQHAFS